MTLGELFGISQPPAALPAGSTAPPPPAQRETLSGDQRAGGTDGAPTSFKDIAAYAFERVVDTIKSPSEIVKPVAEVAQAGAEGFKWGIGIFVFAVLAFVGLVIFVKL